MMIKFVTCIIIEQIEWMHVNYFIHGFLLLTTTITYIITLSINSLIILYMIFYCQLQQSLT